MNNRYARNRSTISDREQARLGRSHVLIAGLGGLGGTVLEQLLRLGVGHITGADGDYFEAGNLNRQLLCTEATLGMNKARAAALHAANVNPLTRFTVVDTFLDAQSLPAKLTGVQVLVDALGGLSQRKMLHQAATDAGIPVVSAGIAGYTGWVKVIRPGEPNPVEALALHDHNEGDESDADNTESKDKASVEEQLGNLAPVASLAASLQAVLTLHLLLEHPIAESMLIFDLDDLSFYSVSGSFCKG